MPRYEHVLPKQQGAGFAQDPPQDVSNASGGLLDKELSISNAAVIGVATMSGKKVVTAGFKAAIQQMGNQKLENAIEIGTTIGRYILIGAASGPTAVFTVPLAIATDVSVMAIENAVDSYDMMLDNERTVLERGVRRKFNTGGYYD